MPGGILYVVATPIGNLSDISQRAIETLRQSVVILCEDTRQTAKLLVHYQIAGKKLISYHQHSRLNKVEQIIDWLKSGQVIALVSDAGTPGISDPGNQLIKEIRRQSDLSITIIPIPGPTALAALASVSGLPTDKFLFLGFLPHKKGRQTLLKLIAQSEYTIFLYESVHRINKLLTELSTVCSPDRYVVVGRELTKKFEQIFAGPLAEVKLQVLASPQKGEYVVGISSIDYRN